MGQVPNTTRWEINRYLAMRKGNKFRVLEKMVLRKIMVHCRSERREVKFT
jgi:hypothetical protein